MAAALFKKCLLFTPGLRFTRSSLRDHWSFRSPGEVLLESSYSFRTCFWFKFCQPRFRFPAAAEGFVERDEVLRHGALAIHLLIFGLIEGTLGVEHAEEIAKAFGVKFVRQ